MTLNAATTITTEIRIPIDAIEIPVPQDQTESILLLLPTTTTNTTGTGVSNSRNSRNHRHQHTCGSILASCKTAIMKIASSLQCGRCIPTPPPPIFHALVSSTYKPIELDNLDAHTTSTSIYHIDNSNNSNNNYNSQVDCPVFISDDDYYEFCHTMNTLIQQYDTIIYQRQRIQFYFNTWAMVSSGIMMEIFLMKYYQWVNDNEMTIIHFISVLFRGFGYYVLVIIIGSIITAALTSSPMKRIKNHQYQLLCKVHQLCHNISFHRLVLVPNPLSVSSSSVSTLAPVKVTFQMEWKLDQDFRGRYSIMEAVKITVVKTISTTTNTDITDENDDDDDDQGVISSNTATTSTVGATATTARNRPTTTTLVEGMTITTTVVTTNIVTTNDECYDEDTVFDSDRCITVIDIPNSNDDEDDNNNSSSEQQHAPLPKKRILHSLDATKIDYEFSNYVIL